MPAPTITLFANNTSPTGPELDNNFLAYAVFTTIPCTVSGTNSLTLAQNSNTPTLTQLTNYLQFAFVAVNDNTGAVTITHPSFGTLNGYKDSPAGPIALSGGEIKTGCMVTARYNSALNSGSGGYHIYTNTAFAGGTISGSLANVILNGGTLAVVGGSLGASLTSSLLSGNSLSVSAVALQLGTSLTTITRAISALATLAFGSITPNNSADVNVVMSGVQLRDAVQLGFGPTMPAGAGFCGWCGTLGTVTVRLFNFQSAATISAATHTVHAVAMGSSP